MTSRPQAGNILEERQATPLKRKLRNVAIVLLAVLVGTPLLLGAVAYYFRDAIDARIRALTTSPGPQEVGELDGAALRMFERKLKAVRMTLEPEPFLTLELKEINSYLVSLLNTGAMPRGLRTLQVKLDGGDRLGASMTWTGMEVALLLSSGGYSPEHPVAGRVVDYLQGLEHFRLDCRLRPIVRDGKLSWLIDQAKVNDWRVPSDLARFLQNQIFDREPLYDVGATNRPLTEARVVAQGLHLKWGPPRT